MFEKKKKKGKLDVTYYWIYLVDLLKWNKIEWGLHQTIISSNMNFEKNITIKHQCS